MNPPLPATTPDSDLAPLLNSLGELIRQARQKALRVVDTLQVQTCWNMGRHIIEYEQAGRQAQPGPLMASNCYQHWPNR